MTNDQGISRRQFLRRSSGVLVPAAAAIFVPQFGSWFRRSRDKPQFEDLICQVELSGWEWDASSGSIWGSSRTTALALPAPNVPVTMTKVYSWGTYART